MDAPIFPGAQPQGRYRVGYLMKANAEGHKLLNDVQYAYAVRQAERLRDWGDPEEMALLRTEPVDEFYELKLKGNVLGKLNLRLFFGVYEATKQIVILGPYKKEEEDDLPEHVVIKFRNRCRVVGKILAAFVRKGSDE